MTRRFFNYESLSVTDACEQVCRITAPLPQLQVELDGVDSLVKLDFALLQRRDNQPESMPVLAVLELVLTETRSCRQQTMHFLFEPGA